MELPLCKYNHPWSLITLFIKCFSFFLYAGNDSVYISVVGTILDNYLGNILHLGELQNFTSCEVYYTSYEPTAYT